MKEYKHGKHTVRVYGTISHEKLKSASIEYMKKILKEKSKCIK